MADHTPGPWKLILHGNEEYPFPLSVHAADETEWVARGGTVSSLSNARLITQAPDLLAERDALRDLVRELAGVLDALVDEVLDGQDVSAWQTAKHAGRPAIARAREAGYVD